MTSESLNPISSAAKSLQGYLQALEPGSTIKHDYLNRLWDHYMPNLLNAIRQHEADKPWCIEHYPNACTCNMGDASTSKDEAEDYNKLPLAERVKIITKAMEFGEAVYNSNQYKAYGAMLAGANAMISPINANGEVGELVSSEISVDDEKGYQAIKQWIREEINVCVQTWGAIETDRGGLYEFIAGQIIQRLKPYLRTTEAVYIPIAPPGLLPPGLFADSTKPVAVSLEKCSVALEKSFEDMGYEPGNTKDHKKSPLP